MVYFRRTGNYRVSSDIVSTFQSIINWLPTLTYHVSGRPLDISISNVTLGNSEKLMLYDIRPDIIITCSVDKETYKQLVALHASNCIDSLSPYEYTLQRVTELNLLFAKGSINVLYRSLDDKSMQGINEILKVLAEEYPYPHEITVDDLSNHLFIQNIVFPISVLNAFLYMRRDRWVLLKKCRESMNDAQIIRIMWNQLQTYLEDKDTFYREGKEKKYTLSYNNLVSMYQVLSTNNVMSAYVLLKKYEEVGTT